MVALDRNGWDAPTPTVAQLQEAYEYWASGCGGSDGHEVERILAAHDRALREQIARDIEAFGDSSCVGAYGDYGPPAIAVSGAASIARGEGSE